MHIFITERAPIAQMEERSTEGVSFLPFSTTILPSWVKKMAVAHLPSSAPHLAHFWLPKPGMESRAVCKWHRN